MPDFGTHIAVPCTILFISYSTGLDPFSEGIRAASMNAGLISPISGAAFIVGSIAVDAGGVGYGIAAWFSGRKIYLFQHSKWSARRFAALDRKSWWPILYKFPHSILGTLCILYVLSLMVHEEVFVGYALGHGVHLALDYPTHRTCWLLWPFIKISSRDESWDWWTMWPYNTWWWERMQFPIIFVAIVTLGSITR